MLIRRNLLALGALCASLVSATPIEKDAVATNTCNPISTFTAKFDKLAGGSVPDGFGGAHWTGFTVTTSPALLNAKSAPNVLQVNSPETSFISASGVVGQIKSFFFGCNSVMGGTTDVYIPSDCSIMVTALSPTTELSIENAGPFSFTIVPNGNAQNMTKVVLPDMLASQFYFQLVGGPSSSNLFLDNVVIASQDDSCTSS